MNKLLSLLAPYNKAIVPAVVGLLLALLAKVDVMPDMTVREALTMLVTVGLVWLVPNVTGKKR